MFGGGYRSGLAYRRISRRRVLGGAVTASAAAAAYAAFGCDDDGDDDARRGGTLRTGTTLPLGSGLDPHTETGTGLAITPRVYGYLLHVDPRDDSVMYDHAASVEQPDETTYVFDLHESVRFHDLSPVHGRVVGADDVLASIERYRSNPLIAARTWHETVFERAEAPDAQTVRVTTKRPYVYSLSELGGVSGGVILPKELVDRLLDFTLGGIGSGPFRVEKVGSAGRTRIARHEAYFRDGLPYVDAMEWHVFSNDEEKLRAFRRRDVDVVVHRDAHEAATAGDVSDDVVVTAAPSLSWLSLGLRTDRAPFNDPRVRQAFDLALDRERLIRDLAAGEGDVLGPVNSHLAGGFWSLTTDEISAAQSAAQSIDERRAAARSLLQAAGASDVTIRLQVSNAPQLIDTATIVREQLEQIGVTVELEEIDLIRWFGNLRGGDFEATLISHLPYETPDIPTRFYHSGGPFGANSPFGFSHAAIDRLIERSWGEADRDARRDTLLEAQRLMLAERPLLPLFSGTGYSSAWGYVRDRRADVPGSLPLYNYETWLDGGPTVESD